MTKQDCDDDRRAAVNCAAVEFTLIDPFPVPLAHATDPVSTDFVAAVPAT
jgi:hypothetical protein